VGRQICRSVAWWLLFDATRRVRDPLGARSARRRGFFARPVARLNLAFSDRLHMRDEARVLASLGHNIYELLRLRERADLVVRYEDARPIRRNARRSRHWSGWRSRRRPGNIEAALRRRGGSWPSMAMRSRPRRSRAISEPPGPIRARRAYLAALSGYSAAFGYETPPPAGRIADHPFAMTPFRR
jgi:hypothetical protein